MILVERHGTPARHEPRTGLDEISLWLGAEPLAGRDPHAVVRVDTGAAPAPRVGDRLVADGLTADPHLPQGPVWIAQEEAADDGLGMTIGCTPVVQPARLGEVHDAYAGSRERMAHHVDRGLLAVVQANAGELV